MPDEISLIPKEYKGKTGFGAIFSKAGTFVIVLLVLAALIYSGLFYYNNSLNDQFSESQKTLNDLNSKRDLDFEKQVISLEKTLKNLKTVLGGHVYWSALFTKLEKLTVPQITFSKLNAGLQNDGSPYLSLNGRAPSYSTLAKQMAAFSSDPLVSDVKISGINLGTEGGIDFSLNINFLKDILQKQK